ncbi:MAG: hypothetical protein CVV45_14870 [Spirochaetae bacterium HGW-Spirochaetae-10]|nr:MAG: hypothetical protein CVV45_14870 [Spirochaetae bacterium HGW-Spirochaetae-10]
MPVFDFRLQCIGLPAVEFAPALLRCLSAAPMQSRLIQEIYEDDGRGLIRDFLLTEYSADVFVLELIHDRKTDAVVNFQLYQSKGNGLFCRQRPWPSGQPYRLIGENIPWYTLRAGASQAGTLLRFFVHEIEQCGMNGYLTTEEKALNDSRLLAIENGNDPHLVIYRYREIEYRSGYDEAMRYLDGAVKELPEFALYLKELKQTLASYRKGNH